MRVVSRDADVSFDGLSPAGLLCTPSAAGMRAREQTDAAFPFAYLPWTVATATSETRATTLRGRHQQHA